MKSWYCDCSRLNPHTEHKCLSCQKSRPDFSKNHKEFLDEKIEDETGWQCKNCGALHNSHKLIRCVFCSTLRSDLVPKQLPPMENIPLDKADQPEFENAGGSKDTSFGHEKKEYSERDLKHFAKNANLSKAHTTGVDLMSYESFANKRYKDCLAYCLHEPGALRLCLSVIAVGKDEVWMSSIGGSTVMVMKNGIWAEIKSKVHADEPKKMDGILPLMEPYKGPEKNQKDQKHDYVEFTLGSGSDESKVSLRFDKNSGGSIKWIDCMNENVKNYIKADVSGLAKLERMKVAIELMEKHILKSCKNG